MKFAYLLNAYPMTSTTFIRNEIAAHERAGHQVDRFAIRRWDQPLVDARDMAEAEQSFYLLEQGAFSLAAALLCETISNPRGMARAARATRAMMRNTAGARWKQWVYLLEAVTLKREAVRRGTDHIHTHFSTNSAGVAMLSHLMGGPGYSITMHGPDELYEMAENSLSLKVEHAAFVAVITNYCHKVVDDHTGQQFTDKIHVVRCGLSMDEVGEGTPAPNDKALVCVGRLCEAKAQVLLMDAVARVRETHPDMRLTLIGDGDTRPAIEAKIAQHGLQDQVILAGWKANTEVRQTIADSRALVLPSLAEGLPIVIMESFALMRPVLSTRITGIPELVDDTCGWLAEPGDLESLVACLEALLSADPATLSEMGRIGHARVAEHHDQDRNAAQIYALFPQK